MYILLKVTNEKGAFEGVQINSTLCGPQARMIGGHSLIIALQHDALREAKQQDRYLQGVLAGFLHSSMTENPRAVHESYFTENPADGEKKARVRADV